MYENDGFVISTDRDRIDRRLVHDVLRRSYWAEGIAREVVDTCLDHALCFGLYRRAEQVGFARVITDYARFAYLADVFVIEAYRGRGLGTWLVECILAHPSLQRVEKWMLTTHDAHGLYARFGFAPLAAPEYVMERRRPAAEAGQIGGRAG